MSVKEQEVPPKGIISKRETKEAINMKYQDKIKILKDQKNIIMKKYKDSNDSKERIKKLREIAKSKITESKITIKNEKN